MFMPVYNPNKLFINQPKHALNKIATLRKRNNGETTECRFMGLILWRVLPSTHGLYIVFICWRLTWARLNLLGTYYISNSFYQLFNLNTIKKKTLNLSTPNMSQIPTIFIFD